eukprot:299934_1
MSFKIPLLPSLVLIIITGLFGVLSVEDASVGIVENLDDLSLCVGTIVALGAKKIAVLTAAHCLYFDTDPFKLCTNYQFYPGFDGDDKALKQETPLKSVVDQNNNHVWALGDFYKATEGKRLLKESSWKYKRLNKKAREAQNVDFGIIVFEIQQNANYDVAKIDGKYTFGDMQYQKKEIPEAYIITYDLHNQDYHQKKIALPKLYVVGLENEQKPQIYLWDEPKPRKPVFAHGHSGSPVFNDAKNSKGIIGVLSGIENGKTFVVFPTVAILGRGNQAFIKKKVQNEQPIPPTDIILDLFVLFVAMGLFVVFAAFFVGIICGYMGTKYIEDKVLIK